MTTIRIMRFSTNATTGDNGTLVAGGNGSGNMSNQLASPWGVHHLSSASPDLYITNFGGNSVMRWTPGAAAGVFIAGTPGTPGSNTTLLNGPMGIKIDHYLNVYVVDCRNNRVQMFCHNTSLGVTIAGSGVAGNDSTTLNRPRGIAFDSRMNMYIGDFTNRRVQKFLKL